MGFTVTTQLDLSGLKMLEKSCKGITKKHIRYGWIDGKIYPASSDNKGIPIAQVAHWQEYGKAGTPQTPPIPSRPYFRQSIAMTKNNYTSNLSTIFSDVVHNRNPITNLNKLAVELVKDYSESVLRQNFEALSGITVAKKGHSYQMDDSGIMIENFKSKVYRTSMNTVR